ncbi:MAG: class C sortase [Lachnospiraceae bacterium]|nr:class C sortase [Lachnospiraceae bacterium]
MRRGRTRKKEKQPLKARLAGLAFALLFLVGFAILIYPTVSNQWNTWRQSRLISSYNSTVTEAEAEDLSEEWEAAEAYNESVSGLSTYTDAFDSDTETEEDSLYQSLLNLSGDGVMGYISIPKINVKLAIYHGTDETALQTGVGHLEGTDLPIGGEGSHAVIAGHRGLPSARLFTDLDQLEIGDQFYLYILDEVLAYEVDQILPMVDKDDYETLLAALAPVEGEDYVTLYTCTPYGVNTHRLLVRGHRIPYEGETESTVMSAVLQAIRDYYMLYLLMGLAVTALGILAVRAVSGRKAGVEDEEEE